MSIQGQKILTTVTVMLIGAFIIMAPAVIWGAPSKGAPAKSTAVVKMEKGGAQLWTENCARCHGIRDPSTYGDAGWQVATHAMRVRCNLTAEEYSKILEFLKSAD